MNQDFILDMIRRTQPVMEAHYLFTPRWHSRYNVLLQVCSKDVTNRIEIGRRMYRLVRDLDPTIILAINSCMAYCFAQEIGARFGKNRQTIYGHRYLGYFFVPHFFNIGHGQNVLIVDDGVVTGTGVSQAVELVLREGAKCVGVVATYTRHPQGVEGIHARIQVPTYFLADLSKVYPIVPSGVATCDQCAELEAVESKINNESDDSKRNELARIKANLLPRGAYEEFWGHEYSTA